VETERVTINETQYFEDVPPKVWEYQIGGYQVCHKWLEDRERFHFSKITRKLWGRRRMTVTYINRKGNTYYLHQGTTKRGKPKYFFSMKEEGVLPESIPAGYEIYENPNARVFLRRIPPQVFTEEEISIVRNGVKALSALQDFKIEIKGKAIVVFEPDQGLDSLSKTISAISGRDSAEIKEILSSTLTYLPTMRFVLVDEKRRWFHVERMCYLGDADWLLLDGGDLKRLAEDYCPHLGRESFYELI
jgi:hypothetical protein